MKIRKQIILGLVLAICASLFFLLSSHRALAYVATSESQVKNAQYNFVNGLTIQAKIGSQNVVFKADPDQIWLGGVEYKAQDYDCPAKLTLTNGGNSGPGIADLETNDGVLKATTPLQVEVQYNPNQTKCTKTNPSPFNVTPGNINLGTAFFTQTDASTITSVINKQTFTAGAGGVYFLTSEKTCVDRIVKSGDEITYFELDASKGVKVDGTTLGIGDIGNCKVERINFQAPNNAADAQKLSKQTISLATASADGEGDGACTAGDSSCTSTGDSSSSCIDDRSLSWMICPVLNGLSRSADGIESFVASQLNFSVSDNLGPSVQRAWTIFRTLTSIIIVIVMLVMVFSQAIGGGPFDAYTVRKMLPKLVAAIILMQISWVLCEYLIRLSNDAGQAVGQLMAAPFGGPNQLELGALIQRLNTVGAVILGVATTAGLLTAIVASGAIILYGWPILLLAIILVFLALVVALATLLFRNALIVLLVIFSPLAFLAFVLPGTDRYWKIWKDNFVKLLVFFPLVIAVIYGGRIFAWIVAGLGASGPFDLIIVLAAFFGPYFFLPKTFKWGGSFLAMASKAISESAPLKKGGEVARRELVSGEDSAMKRRMGHFAAKYTDKDAEGNATPWRERTMNSLLAGRFIPTQRAKAGMVARGNAFKSKENELKTALASRRREKAASATEDVSIGKQMDLDTIQRAMEEISKKPNQYKVADLEREAKEAMRDLIATGSTLELNGMTVKERGENGEIKERHVWQTGMWRDLLNGSPDLYRQVKGDAPDWVPHRNPAGLPKYRGELTNEVAKRREYAEQGMSSTEIDAKIEEDRQDAGRVFLRTAAGHPELVDDVQYASSLHETVTEMDAGGIARVHPTYFERIGDLGKKGGELYRQGEESGDESLMQVGKALMEPAREFGSLVQRLANQQGGRQQLSAMMGGKDTMEHLDYGLQFSGLPEVNLPKPTNWDDATQGEWKKGSGSLEMILASGERQEQARLAGGTAAAASAAPAEQTQVTAERVVERPVTTAGGAAGGQGSGAWSRGPGGAMVFGQPQVVQPTQGGQFEVRIDHGQLAQAIGEQVGTQFRQALKESGLHQRPNAETPAGTGEGNMPPNDNDEGDNNGGDQNT
jgi:hypothetical protein